MVTFSDDIVFIDLEPWLTENSVIL